MFVRLSEAEGRPDGIVQDREGCLWVALWDGWGVQHYGLDGALLLRVDLPCARITKIAFGGGALRTAYVTMARAWLAGGAVGVGVGGALYKSGLSAMDFGACARVLVDAWHSNNV